MDRLDPCKIAILAPREVRACRLRARLACWGRAPAAPGTPPAAVTMPRKPPYGSDRCWVARPTEMCETCRTALRY